ncbi:MAG TPA: hypothetical protein VLX90_02650 [Steroidobacteraceae bacterium]|nr:hypothetical protein [Steroidobacteraceae bacterium]
MTDTTTRVLNFHGAVSCRREPGTQGLTLTGRTADRPEETVTVEFRTAAPEDLPEALEELTVDKLDASHYRITAQGRDWIVAAASCHVHRDVAAAFYRAIPPRRVPWSKRVLWRLLLAAAGTSAGKWLLLRVRGG